MITIRSPRRRTAAGTPRVNGVRRRGWSAAHPGCHPDIRTYRSNKPPRRNCPQASPTHDVPVAVLGLAVRRFPYPFPPPDSFHWEVISIGRCGRPIGCARLVVSRAASPRGIANGEWGNPKSGRMGPTGQHGGSRRRPPLCVLLRPRRASVGRARRSLLGGTPLPSGKRRLHGPLRGPRGPPNGTAFYAVLRVSRFLRCMHPASVKCSRSPLGQIVALCYGWAGSVHRNKLI